MAVNYLLHDWEKMVEQGEKKQPGLADSEVEVEWALVCSCSAYWQ
jgi:hypothetical protein